MSPLESRVHKHSRVASLRGQRTSFIVDRSPMGRHVPFVGGCLQDGRLIVSAPEELRLGANFSVLASPSNLPPVCER